jgi:hypothetical protein
MNMRRLSFGIFAVALSACVVPVDYDEDDYRPRERARAECVEEAHDQGYRRVDIQNVRADRRGEWEVMMQARDRTGRDARLRCEYEWRGRRARVSRVDR